MLFRCCNEIRNIQAVTVRMTWQHEYNWTISIYFVWKEEEDWTMKLQVPSPPCKRKKGWQIRESVGADYFKQFKNFQYSQNFRLWNKNCIWHQYFNWLKVEASGIDLATISACFYPVLLKKLQQPSAI